MFLLDGHDNCKDNSDEQNPNVTGEVFIYTEYKLNIRVQYIVKGKLFYFWLFKISDRVPSSLPAGCT